MQLSFWCIKLIELQKKCGWITQRAPNNNCDSPVTTYHFIMKFSNIAAPTVETLRYKAIRNVKVALKNVQETNFVNIRYR